MVRTIGRLILFKQIILGHVGSQLFKFGNCPFDEFQCKWQVWNGSVIVKGVRIKVELFQNWGGLSLFELIREDSGLEGVVDDGHKHRAKGREAGLR